MGSHAAAVTTVVLLVVLTTPFLKDKPAGLWVWGRDLNSEHRLTMAAGYHFHTPGYGPGDRAPGGRY